MILRRIIFPLGRPYVVPSDQLGHQVANVLITPSATRDRLIADSFCDHGNEDDPVATLELALEATMKSEAIEARIRAAQKAKHIAGPNMDAVIKDAVMKGVISHEDRIVLLRREALRQKAIRVDDFPQDFGIGSKDAHVRPGTIADSVPGPTTDPTPSSSLREAA